MIGICTTSSHEGGSLKTQEKGKKGESMELFLSNNHRLWSVDLVVRDFEWEFTRGTLKIKVVNYPKNKSWYALEYFLAIKDYLNTFLPAISWLYVNEQNLCNSNSPNLVQMFVTNQYLRQVYLLLPLGLLFEYDRDGNRGKSS